MEPEEFTCEESEEEVRQTVESNESEDQVRYIIKLGCKIRTTTPFN
jgi:hypothetical protein